MTRYLSPDRLGLPLAITASILFGIYPAAVRAIYADGGNVAFMMIATMWARASGLTIYCLLTRKGLFQNREDIRQAFIGGFFQAFSACGVMTALYFMPGPLVIMVVFSYALMLLLFLVWKGEAKFDVLILTTTITALGGLGLVLDVWHKQPPGNLWGAGIAFVAAMAIVLRMYVYGKQTRERNPAVVGAENFLVAALFTLFVLLFKTPHPPISFASYGWVALACATMAAATFIMFYGISYIGPFSWSLFAKLEPIFTAIFSAWFIHEILKPYQYIGMVVVVASLVFYQIRSRQQSIASAKDPNQ